MYSRVIILLLTLPVLAPAQGVAFEHFSWAETLAKAKKENKLVFMDAFTTWCGPCKMLNKQTFPDSSAGVFFNQYFVNLKMDMEKGEGMDLARKYGVEVYPTLLFFNADGVVIHRAAGFYPPAEFLALGKIAIDSTRNLSALETRYRNGNRDRTTLLQLLEARTAAYDPNAGALADEYLKQESDLNTPENKQVILRHSGDPFSIGFKFLVQNKTAFEPQVTQEEVTAFVDQIFENYQQTQPTLAMDQVQRLYSACYPEQGERPASAYRLTYYQQRSDYEHFAPAAADHYTRFPSDDPAELNETAWLFAENVTDPALLQKALAWAQKSVTLSEMANNQHTLARLLAKLGKKKEAAKAAQRSIELAKAAGEDFSQTQKLLEELEK